MNAPDSNPKTRAGGMNKVPLHLIPPRALAYTAMALADGAFKYQPYNWHEEKISASVYYGAALRHIHAWWAGEDFSEDGIVHHLAHAVCCLLMILDTNGTDLLQDNRPPAIGDDFGHLLDSLAMALPVLRERENTQFDLHDIAHPDQDPIVDTVTLEETRLRVALETGEITEQEHDAFMRRSLDDATPEEWNAASRRAHEEWLASRKTTAHERPETLFPFA